MAVVTAYSNLLADPQSTDRIFVDPQQARGRLILSTGEIANGAEDSAESVYHLATVPSHALVHEDTFFQVDAWGFAQVQIGSPETPDALVDQTKVTENTVTPFAMGDDAHGKTWWQVLGYAADPGGMLTLVATGPADAAAAGSLRFRIGYIAP